MPRERNRDEAANWIDLATCVNYYRLFTPGLFVCVGATVQVRADERVQPDILAAIVGGPRKQCDVGPDGCFAGPPNFVADIFPQDSMLDYAERRTIYERAGVVEYVAWQVASPLPIWNRLQGEKYVEVAAEAEDVVRSLALPGFWLRLSAFRARNWHEVPGTVAEGVGSWEHHSLLARL